MRCNGISIVLGIGLAAFVAAVLHAERRALARARNQSRVKEEINVWDSEGGQIPNVATVRPIPDDASSN